VAFFLRSNSNLYEKIGGLLVQFHFFDLMMPLQEAIQMLNDFRPHIVVGPPSLLGFLAAAQAQGNLRITPERLVSVAEVLEPQDQAHLSAVFHAPVHQIYQCTEGLLAVSCKQGSLHIQEDMVILQLEPLQDQSNIDNPSPQNEQSTIRGDLRPSFAGSGPFGASQSAIRTSPVVTDLWRTTQPIIRYRLNDVLRMSGGPCPCGSPFRVIEAIEGRSDDILYFIRGRGTENAGVRPFFPDTIRRMVLLSSPDIEDYMAVQERDGQLHIYLTLPAGADFEAISAQLRASVEATIAQYCCLPADLSIENGLPTFAAGVKRRRVLRRLIEGA
jgi:phenylacetate-CoA ligase